MTLDDKHICAHCVNEYFVYNPLQIPTDQYCSVNCAQEARLSGNCGQEARLKRAQEESDEYMTKLKVQSIFKVDEPVAPALNWYEDDELLGLDD